MTEDIASYVSLIASIYISLYWYAEHVMRTEKCSDTCQIRSDICQKWSDISETCTVAYFGSDICTVNPESARKMSDVQLLFHALGTAIYDCIPAWIIALLVYEVSSSYNFYHINRDPMQQVWSKMCVTPYHTINL